MPLEKQLPEYFALPVMTVLQQLKTDCGAGLNAHEISERRKHYGANILKPPKKQSPLLLFLLQFNQPLIYILLFSSAVTAFLGEWVDSSVIFGVVLLNAVVGFIQESKALRAIDALKQMMSSYCICLRDGRRVKIPSAELVPGDIVYLQAGDKVPADLRIIHSRELQIDESALTGESMPVEKIEEALDEDLVLADRINMAYSGTLVTYGIGTGCVTATGQDTEIGGISTLIETTKLLQTPLTQKISQFSKALLAAILTMAAATFVIGTLRGKDPFEMFMAAVALAVGAIPEGLPAAVTVMLAIGVSRMAKHHAIIRKLPAVETLGCTTLICSDKTGTLTQNQMTVQEIAAGDEIFYITGVGYHPEGKIKSSAGEPQTLPLMNQALNECLKAGFLCNESVLVEAAGGWKIEGDPTEGALIVSAHKAKINDDFCDMKSARIDIIPFQSEHHYMATLHPSAGESRDHVIYLKGSVESILKRCESMLNPDGTEKQIDPAEIKEQVENFAKKGLRVLAFARKKAECEKNGLCHEDVDKGCVFLGLQGMMDPPRPEVIEAIQSCHQAGIQVKMITGDHAITGAAIAEQIGLTRKDGENLKAVVLTGAEIEKMNDEELSEKIAKTHVFARVAPAQKLRLVEAFQSLGHIVAMTGDGVNDAPALRRADIGVAMGITGTEVSKEAADMILTDDNFTSIKDAVREGRGVFDNLIKFITWTLPTNLGEGLVIMVAVIFGLELPILPVQILWINMTTALLLGLSLTFEPKEAGIMDKPPRDSQTPILSRPLIERMLIVAAFMLVSSFGLFHFMRFMGTDIVCARTTAVNVFVIIETFYLFNCRSLTLSLRQTGFFSNIWTLIGACIMIASQVVFTYNPLMNKLFQTAPVPFYSWVCVFAAGVCVYISVAFEKKWRCRTMFNQSVKGKSGYFGGR